MINEILFMEVFYEICKENKDFLKILNYNEFEKIKTVEEKIFYIKEQFEIYNNKK